MKKHRKRKLTQERTDAINRKRDLIEGTELSFEHPTMRLVIGPDGRAVEIDVTQKW